MSRTSIITPTYEHKELLLRALFSLQLLTYPEREVYVVDDCSFKDIYAK